MDKVTIKNRHGLKLVIGVDAPKDPKGLVFIAHGQGGSMAQVHIQAFGQAFFENDYRVVYFDATHSLGESEGDIIDVTYNNYVEDLEDVINWARTQDWYQQPFALCGQSMGAQSTAWYAEQGTAGGGSPLYRFRTNNGSHIYTAYESEKASILANYPSFVLEGPAYYVKLAP